MDQLEACRICVTCFPLKDMDFINIFQPNEEFQEELNFIQGEIRLWQLKIDPDDGLPQRICANCFAKFCSIKAFRKECELSQKRLIESLMQQSPTDGTYVQNVIKNTEVLLPLVANYGTANVSLDSSTNVLVSAVNLSQADVSLNDFPVFDQQFSHFDNPALIDASSTLLDGNLIAPESSQDLGFLPPQNIFTFETAEPPTTGTLPLNETETTSIINDLLEEKPSVGVMIKHDDLEDILQRNVIPNATKLTKQRSRLNDDEQRNAVSTEGEHEIKKEIRSPHNNGNGITVKNECPNMGTSFLKHDESNAEMECDESEMNARLQGLSYACHYCFCPETGSIDHIVFANEDALSQHFFDIHDPNRPYTCPKCPKSYQTKPLRDNHAQVVHKIGEPRACNYCKIRLNGSADVHQYNCQYVGNWKCEHCKVKFSNTPLSRFRVHQRQHERTKNFKCSWCERSFVRKANMEAHQRIHKTDATTAYTCNICKAGFVNDKELKLHKNHKHNTGVRQKCNFCNKDFASNTFLQRHVSQFHTEKAISNNSNDSSLLTSSSSSSISSSSEHHACLSCGMSFKSVQKLQQHLLLDRDRNGKCLNTSSDKQERRRLQLQGVFPCFHCPRRFHLRSQLDKHLNTHDARLRPFQCEHCATRCRTAVELKQHVNVAHLNIKAFSCDKCGKCFGYKKDLRDHMLFHAEINVHCKEEGCDYVCKNVKALNDHIRHKHRLLSCEYCSEQFTRQKLTAHLRKAHRAQIDEEIAGESDNFYKSQLVNNNNDITQISLNLLNTQQQSGQQLPPTSVSASILAANMKNVQLQTQAIMTSTTLASTPSPSASPLTSTSNSLLTTASINSIPITSVSSSLSSGLCSITTPKGNNFNSNYISTHNAVDDVDRHHDPLCAIFATDSQDPNGTTTLSLNGLANNEHGLNLEGNDASNMFLVPPTSASSNDNQLDQYFMASLIDTEQEIIVT